MTDEEYILYIESLADQPEFKAVKEHIDFLIDYIRLCELPVNTGEKTIGRLRAELRRCYERIAELEYIRAKAMEVLR
jgi:hypothetical protein